MKIESVRTHVLDHRLDRAFESASMRFDRRQHCLVEIVCDDGTVGWGECLGPAGPNAAVVKAYAPWLAGRDPLETEKIWLELYNVLRDQGQRGLTVTALSGIDIALWDIKGKHFGVPVSTLLGGRFRDSVRAYATGSFRKDGVDPVADIAAEVAGYAAEGFHAVKIKIGFDVEQDLEVIEAVRDAIGLDMRLMIDANHGYDVLEAVEVGQVAAGFAVDWFEEPVLPEQLGAYRAVREGQPIPVAGGETWHGRYGFEEPLRTRVRRHRPARHLRRRRLHRDAADRRSRRHARRAARAPCLGHRRRDRRRPAVHGGAAAEPAAQEPGRADPRVRPHAQPVPPGGADGADRAREGAWCASRTGRGSASRSTATRFGPTR